ncbi:hypothetical protein ABI_39130 [Asticcacaulis biprosthecium C19]|uniref:DUF4440 domain-containing protein n=1 Tax=Asticcacaulis biprosthecium C19 TaxID=715226 RepID=F4QRX9_9CAUL|nr:hypothetical protein ABI_39130 [Asticcacaulis biprosthecium C19]
MALLTLAVGAPARADFLAEQIERVEEVTKAERAFAAETKEKGFHRGFIAWSTPDAIGFLPHAGNFHKALADALAADPSLAEKPTPLRWWPNYIGVDSAGELAFDLGPWQIEGTDQAGWFFTIWQKQPNGSWKWTLDGSAGKDMPANIPPDHGASSRFVSGVGNIADGLKQDDLSNAGYATKPAAEVLAGWTKAAIASSNVPPFIPSSEPDEARRAAAIADRPGPGQTWTRDGYGASKDGDFIYTWGHVTAPDGTYYLGHYVRVWQKYSVGPDGWYAMVDLFHK